MAASTVSTMPHAGRGLALSLFAQLPPGRLTPSTGPERAGFPTLASLLKGSSFSDHPAPPCPSLWENSMEQKRLAGFPFSRFVFIFSHLN